MFSIYSFQIERCDGDKLCKNFQRGCVFFGRALRIAHCALRNVLTSGFFKSVTEITLYEKRPETVPINEDKEAFLKPWLANIM